MGFGQFSLGSSGTGLGRILPGDWSAKPLCRKVFRPDCGGRWDRGLPADLRRMDEAFAPGYAIAAGCKDCAQVFVGFGAISVAVLDAALKSFSQPALELAISVAAPANAAVATNLGVPGSALKRDRHSNGMPSTITAPRSYRGSGAAHNPWSGSRQVRLGFTNTCFYKTKISQSNFLVDLKEQSTHCENNCPGVPIIKKFLM